MVNNIANITLGNYATTLVPSAAFLEHLSLHTIGNEQAWSSYQHILQYAVWSTVWKVLAIFFIALNFKSVPFIYHLRILNGLRFVLKSQRSTQQLTPDHLFQPLIISSRAPLMEIDIFGHKNNSSYFSDIDICRAHLVTTLFSKAIEEIRGSTTMNGLSNKPRSMLTMPLGAVSCSFRRELKPYETYDMWTRILSWDEKWFYLVTHFVKKGAKVEPEQYTLYERQNSVRSRSDKSGKNSTIDADQKPSNILSTNGANSGIAASALSKVVFKNNRHTIRPEVILKLSGLLPEVEKDIDGPKDREFVSATSHWTRERIETERLRGMKQASLIAEQSALENELNDDVALGRHYDGYGIEGVVATLAQLGGFSRFQLL